MRKDSWHIGDCFGYILIAFRCDRRARDQEAEWGGAAAGGAVEGYLDWGDSGACGIVELWVYDAV